MFKPDERLVKQIDSWLEKNKGQLVKDLSRIIKIPSISESREGIYPFGKNCGRVLDEMTSLAAEYGFSIQNHEYYFGTILEKGSNIKPKSIGLYAHLDVVPFGEEWRYPPLECTQKEGFLIGRGVGDNKGPAICALYALRFLKEYEIKLKNNVQIFYGCSEETGMQDIDYFCKQMQIPDFNLVLDTNFPVCYGEKGLMRAKVTGNTEGNLVSFHAGNATNIIPAKAEAIISGVEFERVKNIFENDEEICVYQDGENVKLISKGISKHVAFPENAVNAIYVLTHALVSKHLIEGKDKKMISAIETLTADFYGSGCGIPFEDLESGRLTCVGSLLSIEKNQIEMKFDIRYPVTVDGNIVAQEFTNTVNKMGFGVIIEEISEPAYVPLENDYIKCLGEICDYVQEKHYEPYTMGGGTYSRHLTNAVGFGPGVPDAPNLFENGHGQGHQPDECILEELLYKGIKTYVMAILELDNML